ncbi:hypothetical protein XMM379_002925 [Aliiroseovarius sp. xm-m-379]|nr:hypothetical protein [Aliiroseovarius sp. xm-d-517]NRP26216.1 hypothetical protein [Aliiroseovarius sp. xm-m-379]NRP31783.1 hypothetical protein [Aliiroseovarius sp. xm-m-314]NRP35015.1 hypothetical protein [Aliiroseovarius sp. xm-a-104]NRP42508.1 hypothetical protein [Aliiroseovarius sp. xm-m-339-2]NRP45763.1 hypothetical protein [Aliiroseovarius sp. xm-m-378]NRP51283.1 hypothetical protein [Aliiroseovarius sp. xm-m-354]NRP63420.1 hypothetical protein [Aliiroseovarius sp. xm-a-151]NRP66
MVAMMFVTLCGAGLLLLWTARRQLTQGRGLGSKLRGKRGFKSGHTGGARYEVPVSACARDPRPQPSYVQAPKAQSGQKTSFRAKLPNRSLNPTPGPGLQFQPQNPVGVGGRRHRHMIEPGKAKPTIIGRIPNQ